MGTWSHEPFGNDTANDWAYELDDTTDFSVIDATLQTALDEGQEDLDADLAMEAIAAIEVLAKSLGHGTQTDVYTDKVDEWVDRISLKPSADLLQKAEQVLALVASDHSELKELWQESEEYELWANNLQQLTTILHSEK